MQLVPPPPPLRPGSLCPLPQGPAPQPQPDVAHVDGDDGAAERRQRLDDSEVYGEAADAVQQQDGRGGGGAAAVGGAAGAAAAAVGAAGAV